MATLVMCRFCKERFDREKEIEDIYWVRPSPRMYYHKSCYDNWRSKSIDLNTQLDEQKWESYIYEFLARDLKVKYNYMKCRKQMENFVKKYKYTYKGMLFALKYFYEIKKGDWEKSENGVGILPFIYDEARSYWEKKFEENNTIIEGIEKQIQERYSRPKVLVYRPKEERKNGIKTYNLDDINLEDLE